uniref:Smr domain-containing protein n=1 Tax=Ananas comosus var. bracteatus TaxID=296719 RepID=A0A6V7Q906_ANACO|nr:unnamed protein product [Ananas comosus var. bracteatus]
MSLLLLTAPSLLYSSSSSCIIIANSRARARPRHRLVLASASGGRSRAAPREMVLGKPTVAVEKGKYGYDVETLIDKLSSLPPRGSIARCLEAFRQRLSLADFALVFRDGSRGAARRAHPRHPHRRAGPRGPARQVPRRLPRHAGPLRPRTALSYTALVNAFARNGDHAAALSLLAQMRRDRVAPTALTYNTALRACARADLPWDRLLSLFAEMRHDGVRPDLVTYNTLLAAAAARALPDQAELVLRAMLEAGVAPDRATHARLVDTFAAAGRLDRVPQLLAEMAAGGHLPRDDPDAYNVLVEAYARRGAAREAVAVLRQMQAAGCAPTAATYSLLLGLYGRSGRYDDVRELFLEMKLGSTAPDAATYNILIAVFGEGGYFREVVTLFRDMLEENVEPNMETYEGVVSACGRGGLHEDAKAVLAHMTAGGLVPSAKAYTGVVEAYGQAALYQEAFVAFNTMHEIGSPPTAETYDSLLRSFARGGLFKEAQAILARMDGAGIQRNEDSFNGLIEAYCQGGHFEDALKAYVEMRKSRCNPNERTLEAVLNVYCTAGLVDESKEQFQEIQAMGVAPSVTAYCMLLSLYAKNDRWDDAYELLDEMKSNRASSSHQVIGSMIKGEYDDESNWQMVEYAFDKYNAEGCGFGLRLYNALLDALWWLGQKARAAKVLSEATKRGLFPELFRQSKLVWSVDVHRMSIGGALTAVSVWLNDIYDRFKRGDDLPHLASVAVVRGEMEKSSMTRGLPIAKAVYSFLKDNISSSSFHFAGWNKGRIVCQRSQLKKLQLAVSEQASVDESLMEDLLVSTTNSPFPLPGRKIHTAEPHQPDDEGKDSGSDSEMLSNRTEVELLPL